MCDLQGTAGKARDLFVGHSVSDFLRKAVTNPTEETPQATPLMNNPTT